MIRLSVADKKDFHEGIVAFFTKNNSALQRGILYARRVVNNVRIAIFLIILEGGNLRIPDIEDFKNKTSPAFLYPPHQNQCLEYTEMLNDLWNLGS